MAKELVVYTRTTPCRDVTRTRQDLTLKGLAFREIDIEADAAAAKRLEEWTGYQSVPTVIVAEAGSDEPVHPPAALTPNQSPRNADRGSMISEPNTQNLMVFLEHNGFVKVDLFRMGSFLRG